MLPRFHPGQRWTSDSEPELGLGTIEEITSQTVLVRFSAAAATRQYALDIAPLRRTQFQPGNTVHTRDGQRWRVDRVIERSGLLLYECDGREIPESDLDSNATASSPVDRLR